MNSCSSVLMLVPQLDRMGGYERQALQLSSFLNRDGIEVDLLSDKIADSPDVESRDGVRIFRIPGTGRIRIFLATIKFLLARIRNYRIFHCHGYAGFSFISILIAKMTGRQVLMKIPTANDVFHIFRRNDLKHRIYQSLLKRVDCFIAVSLELRDELLACGIPLEKICSIPNFVNASQFTVPSQEQRASARAKYSAGKETVFLFVGRFEKRKGLDFLLRAWQREKAGKLWIVGSGSEEQSLKTLAGELNLQDVTFFDERDPLELYQAADVFIFPSVQEGSPNVLLEAMSCGLPCIAARIGGVIDLMQNDRQGLLVTPGSVEELAAAIRRAAEQPEDRKRWSIKAAQTAREKYDVRIIGLEYRKLFDHLLGNVKTA